MACSERSCEFVSFQLKRSCRNAPLLDNLRVRLAEAREEVSLRRGEMAELFQVSILTRTLILSIRTHWKVGMVWFSQESGRVPASQGLKPHF